ncbi:H4MPT-linked C1 transfer pathway protein [ANME-1 cluster archaeon ex4572_4]|nr:MAG: H4MPT-linked C1 transfer pathway protein [ANME-1 cluster archaeon ex4572_4]
MIVGVDVGGANTKVATPDDAFSIYAPLWKSSAVLDDVLLRVKQNFETEGGEKEEGGKEGGAGIEAVGVVMTGELCDCFETRREGVLRIKNILTSVFGFEGLKFFGTDCVFRDGSAVERDPLSFAATNWLASAKFVSVSEGGGCGGKDAIFVDVGSTTTDVIPIAGGEIKAKRSDLERLKSDELIYSGVLRTSVATLLRRVRVGGRGGESKEKEECRTASEFFAITADAYLVLGDLSEEDYRCESPDRAGGEGWKGEGEEWKREGEEWKGEGAKSRRAALRRLARVVCSDLEELGEESVVGIAEQVKEVQVAELAAELKRQSEEYGLERVVSAGIGDFVAKAAAERVNLEFVSLASVYGAKISAAFPAFAVARLLDKS